MRDKEMIKRKGNDLHELPINCVLVHLKQLYGAEWGGLHTPEEGTVFSPVVRSKAVQLHHNGSFHWVVSARVCDRIIYCDSMNGAPNARVKQQMLKLYQADMKDGRLRVEQISVQQQSSGSNLCGFYALAFVIELLQEHDVLSVSVCRFNEGKMREHLVSMLDTGRVNGFIRNARYSRMRTVESMPAGRVFYVSLK
jgi:hypothetical protein